MFVTVSSLMTKRWIDFIDYFIFTWWSHVPNALTTCGVGEQCICWNTKVTPINEDLFMNRNICLFNYFYYLFLILTQMPIYGLPITLLNAVYAEQILRYTFAASTFQGTNCNIWIDELHISTVSWMLSYGRLQINILLSPQQSMANEK